MIHRDTRGRRARLAEWGRGGSPVSEDDAELLATLDDLDNADNYAAWIEDLIRPYLGGQILEVGAGRGTFTRRLAAHGKVIAVEPAPGALGPLSEVGAEVDARVIAGDLTAVPEGTQATSAVFINVLEHIEGDVDALITARSLVEPGGNVIVFVPAFEVLYSRFDAAIGHYRRYRKDELTAVFQHAGLDVVDIRYVNAPGWLAWLVLVKLLRLSPTSGGASGVYDRFAVPVIRRVEARWRVPFGQSILCIGRRQPQVDDGVPAGGASVGT